MVARGSLLVLVFGDFVKNLSTKSHFCHKCLIGTTNETQSTNFPASDTDFSGLFVRKFWEPEKRDCTLEVSRGHAVQAYGAM